MRNTPLFMRIFAANTSYYVIMNWKILNHPLGIATSIGVPSKKEMPIPLAVPIGLGVASIASSLFGASKSKEAAEEAMKMQQMEKARLEAERLRKMNENYVDTAAGQNMLRVARDQADKLWKREAGAKAVAGGTDAAAALAKEQGSQMVADTISNMAVQDTMRKDNIDASYRADISRVNQGIQQSKMAQADATAQAASGASNALLSGALTTFGGTKLGQSWFGDGATNNANAYAKQLAKYNPFVFKQVMFGLN